MNNNFANFWENLNRFRQSMQGKDPDQIIQQMMNSGKLSQSQYEQARQQAIQIQKMMSPGAHG